MDAAPTAARRLGRWLDWCADHVGDLYFVVLAAIVVAGVAVAIYSAL